MLRSEIGVDGLTTTAMSELFVCARGDRQVQSTNARSASVDRRALKLTMFLLKM
jgi:hypothetical protein